tara:strand:- start:61 stop:474 length:414 start_codon:yes stop_codon:yes gene_type:complete
MRLLEQNLVQLRGFQNVKSDDKISGVQIPIRLKYYRGVWASQLRSATVKINGIEYKGNQIFWTINGVNIEQSDLPKEGNIHWNSLDVAMLTIRKEGGLLPGSYNVKITYDLSSSYMPPEIDTGFFECSGERKMILVK